jgi:hypothetical protein
MGEGDEQRVRKGDRGFLLRLAGAVAVVFVLAFLLLTVLDRSRLGSCTARGFFQVTETQRSD